MVEELWIAQVHLRPRLGSSALSKRAKGAYANAVALARGVRDFRSKVMKEANDYGLSLVGIEDAAPFARWSESNDVSHELQELANSIERPDQVRFDAFYEYSTDEEIQ